MTLVKQSREALLGVEEKEGFSIIDYFLMFILVFMIANVVIQSVWLSPVKVDGDSMNVTLQHGDWLYMSKTKEPEVGDVVVFEVSENINYIKRIIALEGDSVRSVDGVVQIKKKGESVWVNYQDVHAYYFRKPYGTYLDYSLDDIPETLVGEGEMYVLGDNRWDSRDSRDSKIGLIKTDKILGVVPEWSIKHRKKYAGYLNFIEKISNEINAFREAKGK